MNTQRAKGSTAATSPAGASSSSSSSHFNLGIGAAVGIGVTAVAASYLCYRYWRRRRGGVDVEDPHSMPLPSSYTASFDYSPFDILVLFPSTREAERQKHYAVMSAEHLPGAGATLLQAQDAQKKACTYGLDDSETELILSLRLLRPKSIQFVHVSLDSYTSLFDGWTHERKRHTLVLNLCDGTERDGIIGLSMLKYLTAAGVAFTGADAPFFVISTYKTRMKERFDAHRVQTSPWMILEKAIIAEWKEWRSKETNSGSSDNNNNTAAQADLPPHALQSRPSPFRSAFSPALTTAFNRLSSLSYPLLVKPDDSYASCGISVRSVAFTPESALDYAMEIADQFSDIFVEQFIKGREFTVLIAGDGRKLLSQSTASAPDPTNLSRLELRDIDSDTIRVFEPVERAFDETLPFWEQFISYELFWEIARRHPGKDEFVFQAVKPTETILSKRSITPLTLALKIEALRAYIAVGGCGYARVDMRYDPISSTIAVLEVNANCGITQYKQTAMGEILRESQTGFYQVLDGFFKDAIQARDAKLNGNTNPSAAPPAV